MKVGLPDNFRFYDLRRAGHTLTTESGVTPKGAMVRVGQSTARTSTGRRA
ncbi:hypothetical protein ACFWDI_27975 [Streptomyces sp. NPDC060064]